MKAKGCFLVAALLLLTAFSGNAFAGGWGPYFSWGRDQPSAGIPDFLLEEAADVGIPVALAEAVDLDFTLDHLTFGLLYDSAPSRDKLFNYRGTFGFDLAIKTDIDAGGIDLSSLGFDVDGNGYGLTTTHTFGFALVRTKLLKWWIGPGLRLNFNYYSYSENFPGQNLDIEAANLIIGGGGETGINLHISPTVSLSLGGGVHWNAFGYAAGSNGLGGFVWGDGPFYFVQVAALFLTGQDKDAWASGASAP
jgi:hypothetical protein